MKAFTISAAAAALLAAFAYAAPTSIQIQVDLREFEATITFEGAADASFTKEVPTDGSYFYISMSFARFHIFLVPIILIDPPFSPSSDACKFTPGESC